MKPILSTKVRNLVKAHMPDGNYSYHLKNIIVNGAKRGCSGFVKNEDNGSIVYLTTEPSCMPQYSLMYRSADTLNDYSSLKYRNNFGKSLDDFISGICQLLETPVNVRSILKG